MATALRSRPFTAALVCAALTAGARPAGAQHLLMSPTVVDAPHDAAGGSANASSPRPSLFKPFTAALGDVRRLPTRQNLDWLVVGLGAAAGVHAADANIAREASGSSRSTFKPGAIVGGTPFELGAAFATYAIGRATNHPRAMALGSDLIRAQLLGELMTTGIKQSVRRARPERSGFSFPSGHTTVTFASATVLQRHFGWKVGLPAYAIASYVAASRVEMRRHYLSDVVFGAALGIVAGRTVTIGRGPHLVLTPLAASGGGGLGFTWVGRR